MKSIQELKSRKGKKSILGVKSLSKRYFRVMLGMQEPLEMKYRHRPRACPLSLHRNMMK